MARGIEIRVLDGVNTRSFGGSGCESFWMVPFHWIHGVGKFGGETFSIGCGRFFSWGVRGRGKGTPRHVLLRRFQRTTRVPNNPLRRESAKFNTQVAQKK
jgi:hypothetical protein